MRREGGRGGSLRSPSPAHLQAALSSRHVDMTVVPMTALLSWPCGSSHSEDSPVSFWDAQRIRNQLGVFGPLFFATLIPQLLLHHRVSYLPQGRMTGFHADARPFSMERTSRATKFQSERIDLPDWSRRSTNASALGCQIMVSRHDAIYSHEHQLQFLFLIVCYA